MAEPLKRPLVNWSDEELTMAKEVAAKDGLEHPEIEAEIRRREEQGFEKGFDKSPPLGARPAYMTRQAGPERPERLPASILGAARG